MISFQFSVFSPSNFDFLLQDDFDEFDDVDELYSSLPLDKVETLEDLVTIPPGLSKVSVYHYCLVANIIAHTHIIGCVCFRFVLWD